MKTDCSSLVLDNTSVTFSDLINAFAKQFDLAGLTISAGTTVGTFSRSHPTGSFLLLSRASGLPHVIAVFNGVVARATPELLRQPVLGCEQVFPKSQC
jgi:hypothetical protein